MQLIGDKEVLRMFEELPVRAQKAVVEPLLKEASRIVARIAKGEAPKETGLLERALGPSKLSRYRGGSALFVTVGARRGYRRAVTATKRGKARILSKAKTEASPGAPMRDPARYIGVVSKGRKAVTAKGRSLYSRSLDRFFGKSVGPAEANPFMDRAYRQAQGAVTAMFAAEAPARIEAEAAKLGVGG